MTRPIVAIYRLAEEARAHAAERRDSEAAATFAVAADAVAEFGGLTLWAQNLRNEARRYAVAAWLQGDGAQGASPITRGRLLLVTADDVYPYTFTNEGQRPQILDADHNVHDAPGEVYRWRFQFARSGIDMHVRITRRGRIEWDREFHSRSIRKRR